MRTALLVTVLAIPMSAQYYQRHYFTIGGGGGAPGGRIGGGILDVSPALRIGYGFRFHRFFQVEGGLDTVFHAARINDYFESRFGDLRIKDYQYMVPVGGRAVVPLWRERILFSAIGGGAYLRYQEQIRQPFEDARVDCRPCRSRSGFGYYAGLGASIAMDPLRRFRLGTSIRVYRAGIGGDAFGRIPSIRTYDTWVVPTLDLTVSF